LCNDNHETEERTRKTSTEGKIGLVASGDVAPSASEACKVAGWASSISLVPLFRRHCRAARTVRVRYYIQASGLKAFGFVKTRRGRSLGGKEAGEPSGPVEWH
jgi:hypothetical protein